MRWINRQHWFFPAVWAVLAGLSALLPEWRYDYLLISLALGAVGVGFYFLCTRLLREELRGLSERLLDDCDPEPMLQACREIAGGRRGFNRGLIYYTDLQTMAMEAAGLLGQLQEAERLFKPLLSVYQRCNTRLKLNIELRACGLMLQLGRLEDARSWLQAAEKKIVGNPALSAYLPPLENRRRIYRMQTEGASEDLLSEFLRELDAAENADLYTQVCGHANAAKCLLSLGRPREARPHLEFVAANGNKLAVRGEAEERLRELDAAGLPEGE